MIRILESRNIGALLARRGARLSQAEAVVRPILEAVRSRGDRALLEYARQFDGLERKSVRVPEAELRAARRKLAPEFCRAVETAAANIRAYAQPPIAARMVARDVARPALGANRAPARYRGGLHPLWPLPPVFHPHDDRDSGTSRGRPHHLRRLSPRR